MEQLLTAKTGILACVAGSRLHFYLVKQHICYIILMFFLS